MTLEIKHLQTSEAKIDLSHQKDYFAEWQMAELKVSKAEKEIRRLKRALWLARAERALTEAERYKTLEVGWKMFRGDYETAKEYSNLATKWDNVEQLCKSKAKEYK